MAEMIENKVHPEFQRVASAPELAMHEQAMLELEAAVSGAPPWFQGARFSAGPEMVTARATVGRLPRAWGDHTPFRPKVGIQRQ